MQRRLALAYLVVAAVALFPACRSTYYDAMERVGKHKRDILRDRVESGREEQEEAQEQFQTTYERFVEVTGYRGGDLEEVYERLKADYERSESKAEAVRDRIGSIEQVAGDLFDEWQTEAQQITNAELRRTSEKSLSDTRARYGQLIGAMKRAESKMDPVLVAFRDQVLFLKHNLNAQAIASLEGTVLSIEDDVAALIAEMGKSIREAQAFAASLEG